MEYSKLKYTENQAKVSYNSKIILTKSRIQVRRYSSQHKKLKTGFELLEKINQGLYNLESQEQEEQENQEPITKTKRVSSVDKPELEKVFDKRNLSRTRNLLIAYVSQNKEIFKSFLTLTFKDTITDINEANKKFKSFITQLKRKYPDFKYIGVPEFQKNGRVHYHILTSLRCGEEIPKQQEPIKTYNQEKGQYYEFYYYNIPYWIYGYSTAQDLDMTDDKFNIALYITKYLYKDIDNRLWGHNKILKSNNLEKPNYIYLEENSEVYKKAIEYIESKNYDKHHYNFISEEPYIDNITIDTYNNTDLDSYNYLIELLKDCYCQNIP